MARVLLVVLLCLGSARALCPNQCNRNGYCTGLEAHDTCICAPHFTGDGCQFKHCPRGDDPLTTDQGLRTISMTTEAASGQLGGYLKISFMGKSTQMNAKASDISEAVCGRIFSSLPGIGRASCARTYHDTTRESATWRIVIEEWSKEPVDALVPHLGNPPLSAFGCDVSDVVMGNSPGCRFMDLVSTNLVEHVECSNHGSCNLATGDCLCDAGWKGDACSNNDDSGDAAAHVAEGPFFKGTLLRLKASRPASSEYSVLKVEAGNAELLKVDGLGNMDLPYGSLAVGDDINILRGSLVLHEGDLKGGNAQFGQLRVQKDEKVLLSVDGDDGVLDVREDAVVVASRLEALGPVMLRGDVDMSSKLRVAGSFKVGDSLVVDEGGLTLKGNFQLDGPLQAGIASFKVEEAEVLRVAKDAVSVRGKLSVDSGGLEVAGGGAVVAGGLEVSGGLSLKSGSLVLADGLNIEDGGLRATTTESGGPAALTAVASHAGFGGTALEVKVVSKSALLIEAKVGDETVFAVDGTGAVDSEGPIRTKSDLRVDGRITAAQGLGLKSTQIRASKKMLLDASKGSYYEVLDDGAEGTNEALIVGEAFDEQRLLFVRNSDAHQVVFTALKAAVPPWSTALFIQNGRSEWERLSTTIEAGDLRSLKGIESLQAASNLDIGAFAFRASSLSVSEEARPDRVVFFGEAGKLSYSDSDLIFEKLRDGGRRLRVNRLQVTGGVDGNLEMRGHAISDARLERGSALNLDVVTAKKFQLLAEEGAETLPPTGWARPALFVKDGQLDARAELYYNLETSELHLSKLGAHKVTGDVEWQGHLLKEAKIMGGSIAGIDSLSLSALRLLFNTTEEAEAAEDCLFSFGVNGSLVPNKEIKAVGGTLVTPSLKVDRIESDVDMAGSALRNAHLEGGSAAGLEFLAAETVLVTTLAPPDGLRSVLLAGPDGTLEQQPGLELDRNSNLRVPESLNVNQGLRVGADTTLGGSLVVSGTVMGSGAYVDSSDARFKLNMRPIEPEEALEKISKVKAYRYEYDLAKFPERGFSEGDDIGVIAQDLTEDLPELVKEDAEGYMHVAYSRLTPLLAVAVGALSDKNAELESRLDDLERRLQSIIDSGLVVQPPSRLV